MGLFNKRNTTPVAADTAAATGAHKERTRPRRSSKAPASTYNTRPSFGQWLKATWLDIVTMAAMGAVGLGVYMADPAPTRSFPSTFISIDPNNARTFTSNPMQSFSKMARLSTQSSHTLCATKSSPSGPPR